MAVVRIGANGDWHAETCLVKTWPKTIESIQNINQKHVTRFLEKHSADGRTNKAVLDYFQSRESYLSWVKQTLLRDCRCKSFILLPKSDGDASISALSADEKRSLGRRLVGFLVTAKIVRSNTSISNPKVWQTLKSVEGFRNFKTSDVQDYFRDHVYGKLPEFGFGLQAAQQFARIVNEYWDDFGVWDIQFKLLLDTDGPNLEFGNYKYWESVFFEQYKLFNPNLSFQANAQILRGKCEERGYQIQFELTMEAKEGSSAQAEASPEKRQEEIISTLALNKSDYTGSDTEKAPEKKRAKLDEDVSSRQQQEQSNESPVIMTSAPLASESEPKSEENPPEVTVQMEIEADSTKPDDGGTSDEKLDKNASVEQLDAVASDSGPQETKEGKNMEDEKEQQTPEFVAPVEKQVVTVVKVEEEEEPARASGNGNGATKMEGSPVTTTDLTSGISSVVSVATTGATQVEKGGSGGTLGAAAVAKSEGGDSGKEPEASGSTTETKPTVPEKKTGTANTLLERARDTALRVLALSAATGNDDAVKAKKEYALWFLSTFKAMFDFKQMLCEVNPDLKKTHYTENFPKTTLAYKREFEKLLSLNGKADQNLLRIGKGFYGLCVIGEKILED